MDLARIGGRVADVLADGVTYTIILARLAAASLAMLSLSEAVRGAFNYVEECASSVNRLADTAAGLGVDDAVVSAHNDAATVMRGVLADAESLANEAAEMSRDFEAAKAEHEADYGPVHEAMTNKPGAIADRTYYSNR
ncbi:hypothetical protein ACFCX6_31795 [Streptomyces sp. NPDC056353]|uniref:hypothetical protein n=1 Tax=Streptomyces sp. NPDC056353 TaxID=3345792 RepID=UPI0035DB2F1E